MTTDTLRVMWFVQPAVVAVASTLGLIERSSITGIHNGSSDEQFEALASGRVDLAVTAMDNVIAWNRRMPHAQFRIVAQIERTTPLHLIGRPDIKTVSDIRDGVVLVDAPGNGFVIALQAMLGDAGLDMHSYSLLPAGGVKERFEALLAGAGGCTLLGPPFDTMAVKAGMVRIGTVQEAYPAFPGQGLVMRADAIERLGIQIRALLKGLDAAAARMADGGPDVHQALKDAGFPEAAVPVMVAMRPNTLSPQREGVEMIVRHRRQLNLPGGHDAVESLVDTSLLPSSIGVSL